MSKNYPAAIDGVFQQSLAETKLLHDENVLLSLLDREGDQRCDMLSRMAQCSPFLDRMRFIPALAVLLNQSSEPLRQCAFQVVSYKVWRILHFEKYCKTVPLQRTKRKH